LESQIQAVLIKFVQKEGEMDMAKNDLRKMIN